MHAWQCVVPCSTAQLRCDVLHASHWPFSRSHVRDRAEDTSADRNEHDALQCERCAIDRHAGDATLASACRCAHASDLRSKRCFKHARERTFVACPMCALCGDRHPHPRSNTILATGHVIGTHSTQAGCASRHPPTGSPTVDSSTVKTRPVGGTRASCMAKHAAHGRKPTK